MRFPRMMARVTIPLARFETRKCVDGGRLRIRYQPRQVAWSARPANDFRLDVSPFAPFLHRAKCRIRDNRSPVHRRVHDVVTKQCIVSSRSNSTSRPSGESTGVREGREVRRSATVVVNKQRSSRGECFGVTNGLSFSRVSHRVLQRVHASTYTRALNKNARDTDSPPDLCRKKHVRVDAIQPALACRRSFS